MVLTSTSVGNFFRDIGIKFDTGANQSRVFSSLTGSHGM